MLKSLLIWLGTIAVLILIIASRTNTNWTWTNVELGLLISDVLVGLVAWAYLVNSFDKFLHKKYSNLKATLLSVPFLLLTLIAGVAIILFFLIKFSANNLPIPVVKETHYNLINSGLKIGSSGEEVRILQSALSKDKSIYPSGSVSGYYGNLTQDAVVNFQKKYSLNQTGELDEPTTNKFNEVYGVETRSYYLQTPTSVPVTNNTFNVNNQNNVDPLVNCNVNANCGGGTRQLKQSVCNLSTCCGFNNGTWLFYESTDKCHQDQKANNYSQNTNTTNNNYIRPTTSTYTYPTNPPQNNNPQPTTSTNTYPTTPPQNNNPQPIIDNTAARSRCIGDVNRNLESDKTSYRIYCRANGCDNTVENIRLENEAAIKREQCNSMYP